MVSKGSWKDYGLNISSKQVGLVFLHSQKMRSIKYAKILNQEIKILSIVLPIQMVKYLKTHLILKYYLIILTGKI